MFIHMKFHSINIKITRKNPFRYHFLHLILKIQLLLRQEYFNIGLMH